MIKSFCFVVLILLSVQSFAQNNNHYKIQVDINPQTSFISARAIIKLKDSSLSDTLKFYLLSDLTIKSLHINNGKLFNIISDTVKNHLHTIQIIKNKNNKPININISYSGKINNKHITFGVGCISSEWTELSDYVKWVPLEIHNPLFTYQITLKTPLIYDVSGYGNTEKVKPGKWIITNNSPAYRLAVFLSNKWYKQTLQIGKLKVNVHCADGQDSLTTFLLTSIPKIIQLYNISYGEAGGTFNVFFRNKDFPVNYT